MLEEFFKEQALNLKNCLIFPSHLLFYSSLARHIAEQTIKPQARLRPRRPRSRRSRR